MRTVEQLERLMKLAEVMGYQIRYENLGGVGGGRCTLGHLQCLFIDLSLNTCEQLDQVRSALADDPSLPIGKLPANLMLDLGLVHPQSSPTL